MVRSAVIKTHTTVLSSIDVSVTMVPNQTLTRFVSSRVQTSSFTRNTHKPGKWPASVQKHSSIRISMESVCLHCAITTKYLSTLTMDRMLAVLRDLRGALSMKCAFASIKACSDSAAKNALIIRFLSSIIKTVQLNVISSTALK